GQDNDIQLTVAQFFAQGGGVPLLNVERHLARQALQVGNKLRQQVRPNGKNGTHRQGAGKLVLARISYVFDGGGLLKHQLRLGDDLFTQGRGLHPRLGALEQGYTQLVLQLFNRDTQGGLAYIAALSGPTKVLFLGESDYVAQFSEGHGENFP